MDERALVRLNIGCGPTPTRGWLNYDNSWSVRLARRPLLLAVVKRAHLLDDAQLRMCQAARDEGILCGSAQAMSHETGTVDVIYSSHMLEHLDRTSARQFLREAYRVLRPEGILRLAVPDLAQLIHRYNMDGDANAFLTASLLSMEQPRTVRSKVRYLLLGSRHHAWMYDARSLVGLVEQAGFDRVQAMSAGTTTIPDPGALDLFERADESIYVEAVKPASADPAARSAQRRESLS